jgi:hypothetical protein
MIQFLLVILARCDLGRLDSAHLGDPVGRWLHLANGTELVRCVARNADVVNALEDQLNVADLQDLATTLLGQPTGHVHDIINKVIGYPENGL